MKDAPTIKTRKPIGELTADDFVAFPIWEFALDDEGVEGQDETWVRPVPERIVGKGRYSLSVAADFQTPSGLDIPGFIDVGTAEGVEVGSAVLLPDGAYVVVEAGDAAGRRATSVALGLAVKQTFPLTYALRVRIGREKQPRTGSIG